MRSSVPALPTSIAPRRRRRAGPRRRPSTVSEPSPSRLGLDRRPRARAPPRASSGCRRRRGSARSGVSPSPIAAIIAARCEIDLSGGGRSVPRSGPAGSKRVGAHSSPGERRRRWPSPRTISAARSAASSPATQSVIAPVSHVGGGVERHVLDVDAGLARARARSRRRSRGGCRRRRAARAAGRRRASRLEQARGGRRGRARCQRVDAPRSRRARSSSAASLQARDDGVDLAGDRVAVGGEDVRPDRRVGAGDAGRVAKAAARPRACARTRRRSASAAWETRTLASTCGRWLTVAIRRSWVAASIACGRAPRSAIARCRRS